MGDSWLKFEPRVGTAGDDKYRWATDPDTHAHVLRAWDIITSHNPGLFSYEDLIKAQNGWSQYSQLFTALANRSGTNSSILGFPRTNQLHAQTARIAPSGPMSIYSDSSFTSQGEVVTSEGMWDDGFIFGTGETAPVGWPKISGVPPRSSIDRFKEVLFWVERAEKINGHYVFTNPIRNVAATNPIGARLDALEGGFEGYMADDNSEGRGWFGGMDIATELFELRKALADDIWHCGSVRHSRHDIWSGGQLWFNAHFKMFVRTCAAGFWADGSEPGWPIPAPTDPLAASYSTAITPAQSYYNVTGLVGYQTIVTADGIGNHKTEIDTYQAYFSFVHPRLHYPASQGGAPLPSNSAQLNLWMYIVFESFDPAITPDIWNEIRVYRFDNTFDTQVPNTGFNPPTQSQMITHIQNVMNASKTLVATIPRASLLGSSSANPYHLQIALNDADFQRTASIENNVRVLFFIDDLTDDGNPDACGPNNYLRHYSPGAASATNSTWCAIESDMPFFAGTSWADTGRAKSTLAMKYDDAYTTFP